MNPINFKGANVRLLPPPSDPNVDPIMVLDRDDQRVSVWKPTEEQLDALMKGAHVLLHVWGRSHPPVMISVQKMQEVPGGVHLIIDSSQTRCGIPIRGMPVGQLWSSHVGRVTCEKCKEPTA